MTSPHSVDLFPLQKPKPTFLVRAITIASLGLSNPVFAGVVTLLPSDINLGDTNSSSFTNGNITLTPLRGGIVASFNGAAARLGIDDFGTNVNAFNDPDTIPNNGNEEQLQFEFASTAGLTGLSWDFARADGPDNRSGVNISGFSADPGASATGPGLGAITYSNGTLNIQLSSAAFSNTDGVLTLSNPSASAGATLLMTVTDTTQAGAQLPITSISYENVLTNQAPVIQTPLPALLSPGVGVTTTLSVDLVPGATPTPTYLWEYDNGAGFTTVGDAPTHTFTAGTTTDGTYRVTVTNFSGSDSSSTTISSIDDDDGIDNQWEVDNFGDFLLYGASDNVDLPAPDGLDNTAEFAAGTDPNNPDTDGDGLLDGEEASNNANPLVFDTDGDGFSDGYEVTIAGTLANDPESAPLADSERTSIGISFAATAGDGNNLNLSPLELAGAPGYVQRNWNATPALPNEGLTVTKAEIATPSAGTLVDSSGNSTGASLTIQAAGAFSRPNNQAISYGRLFSGYLYADPNNATVFIDLENIPYARYDVVIYLMGFSGAVQGTVSDASSGLEYTFSAPNLLGGDAEPEWYRSADQANRSGGTAENFPSATHVVFRGLTGSTKSFDLQRLVDNAGVAAIQIVEALDRDGDGMDDFYETALGLDPNDNGTIDPIRQGANGDFDQDGLTNLAEYNEGTNPVEADTDGDGFRDSVETDSGSFASLSDTGTDPRIADTDGDGLLDGVEKNTGAFVNSENVGTNPLVPEVDFDQDGWSNVFEIEALTDPLDASSPGGPNLHGFAIAFNSAQGAGPDVEFPATVYAGAPGVEQRNWNRSVDLLNSSFDASGTTASIDSPVLGRIVDSTGTVIGDDNSGVSVTFTAGHGAWSSAPDNNTPYGRLFNSFIFGRTTTNPDASIQLTGIPYETYDVYVYFGSETNGRSGTVSSTAAGQTYSFSTIVNSGSPGIFARTTDTSGSFPDANYAVFSGQSAGTFDVTTTVMAPGGPTLGIYGIQVINTTLSSPSLVLENPTFNGGIFTADLITQAGGTFIFERSETLDQDWVQIGPPLTVGNGTTTLEDSSPPSGRAFYRVRRQ